MLALGPEDPRTGDTIFDQTFSSTNIKVRQRTQRNILADRTASVHDPTINSSSPLSSHSSGIYGNNQQLPRIARGDYQSAHSNFSINGSRPFRTNAGTSPDHQQAFSQHATAAPSPGRAIPLAPTSLESSASSRCYKPDEAKHDPLTAVGGQFSYDHGALATGHFSQHHDGDLGNTSPGNSYALQRPLGPGFTISSGYLGFQHDRSGHPQSNLEDWVDSNTPRFYGQRLRNWSYNSTLEYGSTARAVDHSCYTVQQQLESSKQVLSRSDLPIQQQHPQYHYHSDVGELNSLVPNPYRRGALPYIAQPPTSDLPIPWTSYGPSVGPKHNTSLLMPYYEAPPYSAFIPDERGRFWTTSSSEPISPQQIPPHSKPNSLSSLRPPSLLSHQSTASLGSFDDADGAVCQYCGEVASRATKPNDRKSNVRRHIREKHKRSDGAKPQCPEPGCGKTFERSDYVLRHRRKSHGWQGSP